MILLDSKAHDLGGGFIVRRVLPQRQQRMIGPFIFLDHMGPIQARPYHNIDVRPHPHIGLSTLTYLYEGRSVHRDSLGENIVIMPGDVNLMTAGHGIVHSERSHENDRSIAHNIHGLQFWLALPDHLEDCEPRFQNCSKKQIPIDENEDRIISIVLGSALNKKSPVHEISPALFLDIQVKKDFIFENSNSEFQIGIYIVKGKAYFRSNLINQNQLMIFEPNELDKIKIDKGSHLAIFGGQKFSTSRFMWWNFVSSSKEKIEEAKKKWKDGRFPKVPNEIEFIPLPEN